MYKLIIAGTRTFNDHQLMEREILNFLRDKNMNDTEIVSGGAKGADRLGELFAEAYNLKLAKFPANWDKYGKAAGYRRNAEMAKYADSCIVFWDGNSKGTKHMVDLAKREGLNLKIVKY